MSSETTAASGAEAEHEVPTGTISATGKTETGKQLPSPPIDPRLRTRWQIEMSREVEAFGPYGLTFFHPENWIQSHRLIRIVLRFTGLLARGRRNALDIHVTDNDLEVAELPGELEGFRILQISDLHLDMNDAFPDVLCERVAGLDYELCVLTGDYRYRTSGSSEHAMAAMAKLRERLGDSVYAILGNHDSSGMVPVLEKMGIRVLLNESVAIPRGESTFYLAGIDDPHYFGTDDIPAASADIPNEALSILLAHSPEVYAHAEAAGFDLMLCGHTHGGQLTLPGGIPLMVNARCPRRLCRGAWSFGRLSGYTSVGAGSTIVDARLNCPPEVVIHRLRRPR